MTIGFSVSTEKGGEMRAIRFLSGHIPDVQTGHSTSANQKPLAAEACLQTRDSVSPSSCVVYHGED